MASLKLQSVVKRYGATTVIHGVDLDIRDGEFVVFVGPSGCGKSTLLRMIAGLEAVTEGALLIDGQRANDVPAAQRGLAMVFQSYALYPHMTVYQNLAFGLQNIGTPRPEIDAKVGTAARLLQLESLLARRPTQLSGGQRQRVAIGRAIVRDPTVFLFDEPLSNLDAELRVQMRAELTALHRRLGTTMIYVTHDQVEAMTMADRIVVLRGGRVEQIGTPLDLYRAPANRFVAGFIGSPQMNFLRGAVVAGADGLAELALDAVPERARLGAPLGGDAGRIVAGVRPEHVVVGRSVEPSVAIEATVERLEHLGATSFAYCALPGGERVTVQGAGESALPASGAVLLNLPIRHLHVFDADDGRALLPRSAA